jgi:RimJ/RimL family protein N-acetyltransferase
MSSVSRHATEVPVIETARLTLRGHRVDDFPDCAAMWADPIVTRFIGGKPFSQEETWARFLRYVGHWSLMGFGYWAIEEKDTGSFVGELGFADFKRDIKPSLEAPELGWALASKAHGKGYATEAVRAAVAWGDAQFGSTRTVCIIHPENLASIRVAEKCGYHEFQRTTYKGHATILFAQRRISALDF